MRCFSGVDVLNAALRKVKIIRVGKGGRDATKAFYDREPAARFELLPLGKET
jgi:hypothetical protein